MDFPRAVRFPVPLDKGNDCSGDEIACITDDLPQRRLFLISSEFLRIFAQFASKIFSQSMESVSPQCRCLLKLLKGPSQPPPFSMTSKLLI